MDAGHAPTGDQYATSSMRCSITQLRAGGCASSFSSRSVEHRPTLELVQRARSETLTAFFRAHNVRYQTAIDRRIAAIRRELPLPELPDYALLRALRGAGAALAPRLLVAFGERRERFPGAASVQSTAFLGNVILVGHRPAVQECWRIRAG